MRTKNLLIAFCASLLILNSGCDQAKKLMGGKGETPATQTSGSEGQTQAKAALSTEPVKCADGRDSQVLIGECNGEWSYNPSGKDGSPVCQFTWGPKTTCPAGNTNPQGPRAVCYGTTVKPASAAETSAESCASKYGVKPAEVEARYRMDCCAG